MTTKLAFNQLNGSVIHVKDFAAVGDGVENDGQALVDADAAATALGGADILLPPGTYVISSAFVLGAGNGLIGQNRDSTVIKQINTSADGVVLSGLNRVKNIRVEAPSTNVDTTTVGLKASDTSDNIVEQVRILYFGYGVYATGLIWRQTYRHVRVENPTNTGFHFDDPNIHLEILLDQCYVVNDSVLGLANKTSYYISGSQGTTMILCTSDGGQTVLKENLGANIINSRVTLINSHWEGYKSPAGFISGAEYDGIVRISGSRVTFIGGRFHNCDVDVVADAALIYAENSSLVTATALDPNTNTLNNFTTQHLAMSNDFGDNLFEISASDASLILAQSGTGAGVAKFTRTGKESKQTGAGATGTHDGANNASVLTDSGASWTVDEFVGDTIRNTTDGSSGTVTANTATTITATLSGGTDNDWDTGDAYETGLIENVNGIDTIVYISCVGNLENFTGAYSDGQKVKVVHRTTGLTVKNSTLFKLQGGSDFPATANSTQIFEYNEEGTFWAEVGRNG